MLFFATVVSQATDTSSISGQINFEIQDKIADLQKSIAPISRLTSELFQSESVGETRAQQHRYEWQEDDLREPNVIANASFNNSTTTIDVNSGHADRVHVDQMLFNTETDEVMFITDVDRSTDTLTVTRGYGNSSAASSNTSSDEFIIMGPAMQQGSGSPEVVTRTSTNEYNYVQIFKHPFETTETLNETVLETAGSQFNRERRKKQKEHVRDKELSYIFGTRNKDTSGQHPRYTTRGLLNRITTNVQTSIGTLTSDKLDDYAQSAFNYGMGEKWYMCGANHMKAINSWARDDLQTRQDDSTFGIRVAEYETTFGMLNLVEHKIFTRYNLPGLAFILDSEALGEKFMNNRNERLEANIQSPDEDVTRSQFLSETGIMVQNEQKHMKLRGVT